MSKKLIILLTTLLILSIGVINVYAHGGPKATDVPTIIKQSVAFLEGIEDVEKAEDKLNEAIKANESQQVADGNKLTEAKKALENSQIEEAIILMIEAIGGDPETDLEYEPEFNFDGTSIILLIIAIISIGFGVMIIKTGNKEKRGIKK